MKRNWERGLVKVLEWTVTGIAVVFFAHLFFTDRLSQWRIGTFGDFKPYSPAAATGPRLFEGPERRTEREKCMDIVDITTDRDLGTRTTDYVQGWMAARDQIIQSLAEK